MTDEDREAQILAAGRHMEAAYAAGDRPTARAYLIYQESLIAGRSPAAVAEMEREYFSEEGERARRAAFLKGCAA